MATARLGAPSAYVVGDGAPEAFARESFAFVSGRRLHAFDGGVVVPLPFDSQARLDVDDSSAVGRFAASTLKDQAVGVALKHAFVDVVRAPATSFALEAEYRVADAAVTIVGASAVPPVAKTYAAHADASSWLIAKRLVLHAHGTLARLTLGEFLRGWTVGAVVGGDLVVWREVSLRGNLGAYQSYGDATTHSFPLTGGIHFGPALGVFADISGTLWPHGVEMVDGPLSDVTVFRLEPLIKNQQAFYDLNQGHIGLLTLQVGYRAQF